LPALKKSQPASGIDPVTGRGFGNAADVVLALVMEQVLVANYVATIELGLAGVIKIQ
jgi:hypothetical protein